MNYLSSIHRTKSQIHQDVSAFISRNVLVYLTLCARYTAQVTHPFAQVAMSLYNIISTHAIFTPLCLIIAQVLSVILDLLHTVTDMCVCVHAVGSCANIKLPYNAALGTQLGKVCYYSITHSSAPSSQNSYVSPTLNRLPALPLQVWLTGPEQDGPSTTTSPS